MRAAEQKEFFDRLGTAAGEEIRDAFAELYSIYDSSAIEWLGSLYDKRTGGFYYSVSAKNSDEFFPDAESTKQALSFMTSSGLAARVGGYPHMFSDEVKEKFVRFAKSMQDENGYFYHSGWGKERTDKVITRRSRDLNWCTSLLSDFGAKPTYRTPNGYEGDGLLADGSKAPEKEAALELSGGEKKPMVYAENLRDEAAFRAYLGTKDIANRSYHACSEIITQAGQIVERDRQLEELREDYRLMDILIAWLNENQHRESGHWHPVSNYYAVNGLYKAARIYNAAKLPMPNAKAAVHSAIAAITSDEPMGAVVDIFNSWSAISYLFDNQRRFGGEAGEVLVKEATELLRASAVECIRSTREKLSIFKKADGSFSYCPDRSAHISAGMPVAVPYTNEGDVNATTIAISGVTGSIYAALGFTEYRVPIYTDANRIQLLSLIEG